MFTRCPNCNAIFEVAEEQLAAHEGLVRCGVCKHVFNAKWFLLDSESEEDGLRQTPRLDAFHDSVDEEAQLKKKDGDAEAASRSLDGEADSGSDADNETGEQTPPPIPEGLFEEIDVRREPSLTLLEEEVLEPEQPPEEGEESRGMEDAAGRREDLDLNLDLDHEPDGNDVQPGPTLFGEAPATGGDSGALLDRERMEQDEADLELSEPSLEGRSGLALEQDESVKSRAGGGLPPAGDAPISVRSVDTYLKQRSSPLATLLWTVAALFFLLILVLQVRTFHIDALAGNDQLRPYVAGFCKIAACELPPRRDPGRFTITHTRIALHPEEPGALRINVNLINEAEFAQPYPALQLTLTDRVGRIVGRRSFRPDEYLLQGRENLLPPRMLGKVQLDLAHPHEQAVGFEINVVNAG
ncbi:MAG: DUF3426 domain-containing protein [Pseudomonadota bacterium]|nr:DUF3426 domain-containing protein [Pseudomonadota bacterium]